MRYINTIHGRKLLWWWRLKWDIRIAWSHFYTDTLCFVRQGHDVIPEGRAWYCGCCGKWSSDHGKIWERK